MPVSFDTYPHNFCSGSWVICEFVIHGASYKKLESVSWRSSVDNICVFLYGVGGM